MNIQGKNKQERQRELQNTDILNERGHARADDYQPTVGTTHGVTKINNPETHIDTRDLPDSTDTDYSPKGGGIV